MFMKACRRSDLVEGGLEVAAVDRTLVLIVWPDGGVPRAYQGFCPHARLPLAGAAFDGRALVCPYHDWVFDGRSGRCVKGRKGSEGKKGGDGEACRLAQYPLRFEGGDVMVDVAGVEANYV